MPINFFLLEIIVNNVRLSTYPVIDERSRIEFSMPTTGIRITVHDNEFKRAAQYSCSTCLFTLDTPWQQANNIDMRPSSSEELDDSGCIPKISQLCKGSKQNASKTTMLPVTSKSKLPQQKQQVLHVEVFKDHPISNQIISVGKGVIDMQHLLDRIGKRIARFEQQKEVLPAADDDRQNSRKPIGPYPVSEHYKAIYPLENDQGVNVGAICVLLRISCFDGTLALSPATIWQPPQHCQSNNAEETMRVIKIT